MTMNKEIGFIGLGKMGYNMANRLIRHDYAVTAYDINQEVTTSLTGAKSTSSITELVKILTPPRTIIISIPAGELDKLLNTLAPLLDADDIIIDSGNSFFQDTIERGKRLKLNGIRFIDCGVSGGISGAKDGACIMIGGDKDVFNTIEHIFKTLSRDNSYKYMGKSGSGHLVKGYHNLVEYGFLQSLAEGLVSINEVSLNNNMDIELKDVCNIWNNGSIVESRLVQDAEIALKNSLKDISGSVYGQTQLEMKQLINVAHEYKLYLPSCEAALNERLKSQEKPTLAGKIINATRRVFGGHQEWKKE